MREELPAPVQAYLRQVLVESAQPLCLALHGDYRLERLWGDAGAYGLAALQPGEDASDLLPLLIGTADGDQPLELRFVEFTTGRVAHVHILPAGDTVYVLLLHVGEAHAYLQGVQQASHDARLRNHYDERLLRELRETQRELEAKKREAESASALKSRFIAAMSHEFRTPLTSVLGYAEIGAASEALDPRRSRLAYEAIRRNASHLLAMVDNILDQARLEADVLEILPAPTSPGQIAASMRDMFQPLCTEKGLAFELETGADLPPSVSLDGMRLRQVLINLLGNAVKFTDRGSVRARFEREGEFLLCEVADTGPGIAASEQRRLFQPFQRGGDGRRPGAGLGLAIARELLERMGGSLTLESAPGEGTRWQLRLPLEELPGGAPADPARTPAPSPAALHGALLLLEDNEDIAELVQLFLQGSAVEVSACADAADALALLAQCRFDLALVDLMLPDMDGAEFLRRARAAGHRLPALAFTATPRREVASELDAGGFAGYLGKPVERDELLAALAAYLGAPPAPGTDAVPVSAGEAALLAQYRRSLPARRTRLADLWEDCAGGSGDATRAELEKELHQLAGSAGCYGYGDLGEQARAALSAVQATGRDGREPPARAALTAVLRAFDAAMRD